MGNDLPGGEGDAPSEDEEFLGMPSYKIPPKESIFKDLEDKSDFKAFDVPGA